MGAGQWLGPASLSLCSRLNKTLPSHRFTSMLPCRNGHQPIRAHAKLRTGREGGEGGEEEREKNMRVGGKRKIKTEGGEKRRMAKKVPSSKQKERRQAMEAERERKDKREQRCYRGKKEKKYGSE